MTEIQGRKSDWKKWKDFGQRKSRKAQKINQSMDDGGEKQRWKTAKAEESTRKYYYTDIMLKSGYLAVSLEADGYERKSIQIHLH